MGYGSSSGAISSISSDERGEPAEACASALRSLAAVGKTGSKAILLVGVMAGEKEEAVNAGEFWLVRGL